jgi:CRISPR-associated protein Cas2
MKVLITYDVNTEDNAGRRRLRKIAQTCLDYGQRVQFSVFECDLPKEKWVLQRTRLLELYEPTKDSLRFYFLSTDDFEKAEHHGTKPSVNYDEPLII